MILRCYILLCCMGLSVPALAQNRNDAVYWYDRAGEVLGTLSEEDWTAIHSYMRNHAEAPSGHLLDVLERTAQARAFGARALDQVYGGGAIGWAATMDAPYPGHMFAITELGKLYEVQAFSQLHAGDSKGASETIASLYRLANHQGETATMGAYHSASGIGIWAQNAIDLGIDLGSLSPSEASAVLRAVRQFDTDDPYHIMDAMVVDNARMQVWLLELYESGDEATLERYLGRNNPDHDIDVDSITAATLDEGRQFSLEVMDAALGAMMLDDADEAKRQIEDIMEDAAQSDLAIFAPWTKNLPRFLNSLQVSSERIAAEADRLKALARGIELQDALPNAATIYLEAIRAFRVHRRDYLSAIEGGESEELDTVLKACDGVIGLLGEASKMRRCDFGSALGQTDTIHAVSTVPSYLAAMHLLTDVVVLDGWRLLGAGQAAAAVDRLEVALGMIRHLGDDDPILSSVLAYDSLMDARDLVIGVVGADLVTVELKDRVALALGTIRIDDPLGFRHSLTSVRNALIRHLGPESEFRDKEASDAAKSAFATMAIDRAFVFSVGLDAYLHNDFDDDPRWKSDATALPDDLLTGEALIEIHRYMVLDETRDKLRIGDLSPVSQVSLEGIATLSDFARVAAMDAEAVRELGDGLQQSPF